MYAAAILGKPISDSRVSELIGPNYDAEAAKPKWAEEWEPRDRESGKEPAPKWDGKNIATTLKPWLKELEAANSRFHS
eukprot:12417533-Karenia_brevis.AAC.1